MNILEGLNPQQEQAVKHFEGPLLLLAGAGSGKTRVLTHRIAYLIKHYDVNPWNILAITFTNKAAGEMRERVDKIVTENASDIWVSTFHSTCVRILRRHISELGYDSDFTIYDADDQKTLMRNIFKYLQIDPKKYNERVVLSKISSAKDSLITANEYEKRAQGDITKELYSKCYKEYEKRLRDSNALDFDDLIFKTIILFENNKEILSYYQNRFRYIMVDEYQDTNTAQFRLINLLANYTTPEGKIQHNLCVVGDDDQSIYKFRGANIYNILNFETQYPEATVIKLEENYRSTQNILDAANAVIKNNSLRKSKALWTEQEKGDLIYFTQFQSDREEAALIVDAISKVTSHGLASYNDFAILYRTNAQSRAFEENFIRNNIPYKIVGGVNFYQRKEIKDLLAYLRTIANPLDDISVKRIINVPKRGIGLASIDKVEKHAQIHETSFYGALKDYDYVDGLGRASVKIGSFVAFIESLKNNLTDPNYTLKNLIQELILETNFLDQFDSDTDEQAENRIDNIQEFVNTITDYQDAHKDDASLSGFLEEISLVADIDKLEDDDNSVLLMTLHSAKGLEFPYVYLVGMEDGLFPGYAALDNVDELEEERRLCYVGITRAKKKLSLSCARSRFRNGELQFNPPSKFIREIPRYLLKQSGTSTPAPKQVQQNFSKKMTGKINTDYTSSWNPMAEQAARKKTDTTITSGKKLLDTNPFISKGLPASKKSAPTIDYVVGDKVSHSRFGTGVVKEIKEVGADYQISVVFDGGMTRKMMASFAKLKKI